MEQQNNNIPLDELRQKKIDLEKHISTIITNFSQLHGVQIDNIDINTIPYLPEKSQPWSAVDITIRLGL